ncbi:MAG: DNA glycosylase [Acidobacteriota bacterium]
MTDTILLPTPFNPELTLCGGQAFRWMPLSTCSAYEGVVADMVVRLAQDASGRWRLKLLNFPLTPDRQRQLRTYFDLDRDYTTAHQAVVERLEALQRYRPGTPRQTNAPGFALTGHPPSDFTLDDFAGLRLLRQPWFETMVSFVISSNNHLPRIRQIISIISRKFGTPLSPYHATFPTPDDLAATNPAILRHTCRVGYRDHALHQLATHVAHHRTFWETAATCPTPELRHRLLALPGIGPKVAECILLFGFHRWEAFPIDVWVRRAMLDYVGQPAPPPTNRQLAHLAATTFGPFAGLAQQYLFELARLQRRAPATATPNEGSPGNKGRV